MRICFVLSQFPETHETFILREFVALADAGLDFSIVSLKPCRDEVVHPEARRFLGKTFYPGGKAFRAGAHELFHSPARSGGALVRHASAAATSGTPFKTLAAWPFSVWVASVAREMGATAIHSHWATLPSTVAMEAATIAGLPFSFTAHAWDIFAGDGLLRDKLQRARFVVTCTDYSARALRELASSNRPEIHLAYHGLDTTAFETSPRKPTGGPTRLLSIGRLVETKGFPVLIDAMGRLQQAGIDFELNLVGSGSQQEALESEIARRSLRERVHLLGTVTQARIRELLADSDIFVLPCVVAPNGDRDGIPNVILEAMAAALPVISTSISGIPEAVIDGETGLLVKPYDARSLAAAIEDLAADRERREQFGLAGKAIVRRKFDLAENAAKLYSIFEGEYGSP